jgi:hypothetical protein
MRRLGTRFGRRIGYGGARSATPLPLNVVFDGNSMTAGTGSTGGQTFPVQTMAALDVSGAVSSNLGVSGQTWRMMDGRDSGSAADVDAAWVDGRRNVLVAWETTNSTFSGARTAAQIISDTQSYITDRLSAHPWTIVLVGALPRGGAGYTAQNQTIIDVNDHFAANYEAMGAHAYADTRQTGSVFDFFGDVDASFTATQAYWSEMSAWVHPNNAGYAVVAGYVAAAINSVPVVGIGAGVASATPTKLVVTFSDTLLSSSVPATGDFVITNSGGADSVTAVSVVGATVELTKSRTTLANDVITVAYTQPVSGQVKNLAGSAAPSFTALPTLNMVGQWPEQKQASEWFDPSVGTTIVTGVSQWVGRRNASTLVQATGAQQPTYNATAINSHPALVFSRAANQRLTGAATLAAMLENLEEFTIISMAQQTSPVNGQTRAIAGAGTVANTGRCNATAVACGAVNTTDTSYRPSGFMPGSQIWGTTRHVQTLAFDGINVNQWLDGVLSKYIAALTIGGTLDEFVIGAMRISGVYANHFEGYIGDILIFDRFLSDADRQAGEAWLATRFA